MLAYPQIDPVAVAIGPLQIHWYGLMYLIGIGGAWWLASGRVARFAPEWPKDKLSDLVFWVAMGVIVGGRLGYVLFYDLAAYLNQPSLILQVWKGGMSFHGGLLGVLTTGREKETLGAALHRRVKNPPSAKHPGVKYTPMIRSFCRVGDICRGVHANVHAS